MTDRKELITEGMIDRACEAHWWVAERDPAQPDREAMRAALEAALVTGPIGATAFGREILLEVGSELDSAGQFCISLTVDGKPRFSAWFTDKSEEETG